jgi:peptidylprolyl isomerase
MPIVTLLVTFAALAATPSLQPPLQPPTSKLSSAAELLGLSVPSDWRPLDPLNTLYLELPQGRVIIELAPQFAPHHVQNIRTLVAEKYFDGLAIVRAQDNYVVQWADPNADDPKKAKSLGTALQKLPAEFNRSSEGLPFTPLPDRDTYAPQVGFSSGFPAAEDPTTHQSWLVHCYGMVGAGRDMAKDSSNGTELYAVIGHSPRHLDLNITLVGRVVRGMDLLSTLRRGTGALGFYEKPEERTPITSVRLLADVPPAQRTPLEVLRTDTPFFQKWIEARRNRREAWFVNPVGRVEICNVPIPVRAPPGK